MSKAVSAHRDRAMLIQLQQGCPEIRLLSQILKKYFATQKYLLLKLISNNLWNAKYLNTK
jgi:hypothetical protein